MLQMGVQVTFAWLGPLRVLSGVLITGVVRHNRCSIIYKEEEFVFPFVVQAAATSARVPRAGIVVPLRRKRTGCGRGCV